MQSSDQSQALATLIESDQRELRGLLWQASGAWTEAQASVLKSFERLLGAHHLAVEQTLLELLSSFTPLAEDVASSVAMHELLEWTARNLEESARSAGGADRRARLEILGTLFERQALKEQQSLLPAAVQLTMAPVLERQAQRYGQLRDRFLTELTP